MRQRGFINVMNELGFYQCGNVCYTDNFANYKFIDNRMSLASKNKHADIRHLMIREWVKQNRLTMEWISTADMVADIATKNLPTDQFITLRDWLTGYHYARHILMHRKSSGATVVQAKLIRTSVLRFLLKEEELVQLAG